MCSFYHHFQNVEEGPNHGYGKQLLELFESQQIWFQSLSWTKFHFISPRIIDLVFWEGTRLMTLASYSTTVLWGKPSTGCGSRCNISTATWTKHFSSSQAFDVKWMPLRNPCDETKKAFLYFWHEKFILINEYYKIIQKFLGIQCVATGVWGQDRMANARFWELPPHGLFILFNIDFNF